MHVQVSMAGGGVMCVSAPLQLHAASRPTTNPGMVLSGRDVNIKVR